MKSTGAEGNWHSPKCCQQSPEQTPRPLFPPQCWKKLVGTSGNAFSILHFLQHCMHALNVLSDFLLDTVVYLFESFHYGHWSILALQQERLLSEDMGFSSQPTQPPQGPCPGSNRDELFSPLDACPPCYTDGQLASTGMWYF